MTGLLIDQSITRGDQWNPPLLLHWLSQLPETVLRIHPKLGLFLTFLLRFPHGQKEAMLPEETWERIEAILQMIEGEWREQGNLTWLGGLYATRALWYWR